VGATVHRGGRRRTMAEINITPLTDVCLVLLVIFMCTAKFLGAGESVDVDLPGASTAQPMDDVGGVPVAITDDGRVYINNIEVEPRYYVSAFQELASRGATTVIVSADKDANYGQVYDVIDAARMANLVSVSLAAQPKRLRNGTNGRR